MNQKCEFIAVVNVHNESRCGEGKFSFKLRPTTFIDSPPLVYLEIGGRLGFQPLHRNENFLFRKNQVSTQEEGWGVMR